MKSILFFLAVLPFYSGSSRIAHIDTDSAGYYDLTPLREFALTICNRHSVRCSYHFFLHDDLSVSYEAPFKGIALITTATLQSSLLPMAQDAYLMNEKLSFHTILLSLIERHTLSTKNPRLSSITTVWKIDNKTVIIYSIPTYPYHMGKVSSFEKI